MSTTITDVLGKALLDYIAGEKDAALTVYSDIAETEILNADYFFRDYAAMPELEKLALNLCRGDVADLGAGAGSHTLVLQNNNINITAFDISEGACAVMKYRGVKQVEHKDIFNLGVTQYDTILTLMNGLGLVGDLEGLRTFLLEIKKNLKPGAQIIADSSDISYMFYDEEEGVLLIDLNAEYHGVVTYQMKYKEVKAPSFKWLFIDFMLLSDYAEQCGYNCELLYEGENCQYLARLSLRF